MTGTYARYKTNNTGLRPLEDRMSEKRIERRTAKIAMRVGREGALTRGALVNFVSLGFWKRMRWVFFGVWA